jgi:hypothetical protein
MPDAEMRARIDAMPAMPGHQRSAILADRGDQIGEQRETDAGPLPGAEPPSESRINQNGPCGLAAASSSSR